MQAQNHTSETLSSTNSIGGGYSSIIRELVTSVTGLVSNEVKLAKEEVKLMGSRLANHSAQAAAFGALLALSTLPFLAFLVIGLGNLLNGQYWLSSLIVAVVCAAIGGGMAYRAFRKIKNSDLDLPRTRKTLEIEKNVISHKFDAVREASHRKAL